MLEKLFGFDPKTSTVKTEVLSSEPQFWVNLWALDGVDDACKLSVGAEVEICNNLVWPTDGKNNRFYAIPTLAAKWTF